ncbi:hypothetical protein BB560_000055 [Smittium megazygosporum]|uniref:Phospholipid/glycerol acyltransferase domain-containing protein n=1 Tax=Smittium megazygosporum TaxID=133381 RepID=A0A2T9ZLI6_9FUNG|nr:hypothetical protein BB560_000055 [Smittium megazygosporum]
MEKYSKWRDFGTGIQPFLPIVPPNSRTRGIGSVSSILCTYVLGVVLSISRLLTLVAILSVDSLFTNVISNLFPTQYLRNTCKNFFRKNFATLLLWNSGFLSIDQSVYSLKKFKSLKKSLDSGSKQPKSGDLIFSNHSSYIDVLYFISRYNPIFVEIDNATLKMKPLKGWNAIISSCSKPKALLNAKDAMSLSQISQDARKYNMGPIVVFPENTTSNGLGLLKPLDIFSDPENIDENISIFITCLKYPSKRFSPTFPMGSPISHYFWLNANLTNKLSVVSVDPMECPTFKGLENKSSKGNAERQEIDMDKEINSGMISCTKLKQTKLSTLDKLDFLAYYYAKSEQYKKNK